MCKIFIFEGPDYAGKTTLVNNLCKYFKSKGKRVSLLKEPDGTIRKLLLDKDAKLAFGARRFLYAADHVRVLGEIYDNRDKYDYIFIDRTAVISDMIYSEFESKDKELSSKMSNTLRAQYQAINEKQYDNYFRSNATLVLLDLPKQELITRMSIRAINSNDIFDIKSDDFKIKVWERYRDLIEDIRQDKQKDLLFIFKRVCLAKVSDNLLDSTIKLIEGDQYV